MPELYIQYNIPTMYVKYGMRSHCDVYPYYRSDGVEAVGEDDPGTSGEHGLPTMACPLLSLVRRLPTLRASSSQERGRGRSQRGGFLRDGPTVPGRHPARVLRTRRGLQQQVRHRFTFVFMFTGRHTFTLYLLSLHSLAAVSRPILSETESEWFVFETS